MKRRNQLTIAGNKRSHSEERSEDREIAIEVLRLRRGAVGAVTGDSCFRPHLHSRRISLGEARRRHERRATSALWNGRVPM